MKPRYVAHRLFGVSFTEAVLETSFVLVALLAVSGCSRVLAPPGSPTYVEWLNLGLPSTPHIACAETQHLALGSESFRASLTTGWRDEEQDKQLIVHDDGTVWAASIRSELRLTVLEPRELRLSIEMQQHAITDTPAMKMPAQQVRVVWNHTAIGTCDFAKEDGWAFKKFSFAVPRVAQVSGANTVTFLSRYAVSPGQLYGEGNDKRSHAFGVKSLSLDDAGSLAGEGAPATATPDSPAGGSEFSEGVITQRPRSRITIPIRLPKDSACMFAVDDIDRKGGTPCSVFVRNDTVTGPEETEILRRDADGGATRVILFDLASWRGKLIELVLETGAGGGDARVVWKAPRILRCATAPASAKQTPPEIRKPAAEPFSNAVVIVLDALRADHVGAYGYSRETTPSFDALAAEGSLMMRAYATVPYTYCSTWSLFVAQYPFQHGAMGPEFSPSSQDIAPLLRQHGVITGLVSANPLAFHRTGVDEALDASEPLNERPGGDPSLVTDKAVDFLRRHVDKRCFLYMHYRQPHAPYRAPDGFLGKFSADPANRLEPLRKDQRFAIDTEGGVLPTQEQRAELEARYDENILAVDAEIGKFMASLRELGLAEKTLVVVTADHGEAFGEHENCYRHTVTVYEPVVHIPMLFCGKGVRNILPGQCSTAVSTVDVVPTVCDLLNVPVPPRSAAGESIVTKAMAAEDDRVLAFAQAAWTNRGVLNLATNHTCEAYWWSRYKLIRDNNDARVEVYDIHSDPEERGNLAVTFPVLTDYLLAHAAVWKADRTARPIFEPIRRTEEPLPQDDEQLKALGYL